MQWKFEPSPALGSTARIGFWIAFALALLVAILLLLERRDGQDWAGDFSLYISHARNLSEGKPYAATGYIVNPYFRSLSPDTYPPLFPLLLTPLYSRFGLDFNALKVPGILCFAASIPLLFCLFRKDLPTGQSLIAVCLWAGWPFILWFKDSVVPDLVFALLWVLALWLLRIAYDQFPIRRPGPLALLTGVVSYAAYATRSVGIVLLGAIIAYEVLRYRRISRFAIYAVCVFGFLALCQNLLIHNEAAYFQMLTLAPFKTAEIYLHSLTIVFSTATSGWLRGVRYTVAFAAVLLSCAGFLINLRRFRSPSEVAVALYVVLLLLWSPGAGTRYIVPVIPFFFFYLVTALDVLNRDIGSRAAFALEGALLALVFLCYITEDRQFRPSPIEGGISTAGFAELCQYITAKTNPADVFVFQNPRVLSLFTRRPASIYPKHGDPQLLWNYARNIHARYLVATDFLEGDAATLRPFVRDYGGRLRMVFSNSNFRLYMIVD